MKRKERVMESKELQEALRLIAKALTDPRMGPDQRELLQSAKRELEVVARSGKLERRRVFLAVQQVATVLLEHVEDEVAPRR